MSQTLTTDAVEPGQRLEYWIDMICKTYVELECDAEGGEGFGGAIVNHALPGLDMSIVRSSSQRVLRTPGVISRASEDYFIVSVQTRGHAVISQDGRDAVMSPGDFAVYDSTRPYALYFGDEFEEVVLKLRRSRLRALVGDTERLTATTVSGRAGAGHLLQCMVAGVRQEIHTLPAAAKAAVAEGMVNVLVAGLQSLPVCGEVAPSSMNAYHLARIKRHIDDRLRDPTLNIQTLASELGISVGHLHRLFKNEPLSPSQYLWNKRLEACSRELLDTRRAAASVAEIAFGWGFNDAAHFSRSFRGRFKLCPRDWRRQHQLSVVSLTS